VKVGQFISLLESETWHHARIEVQRGCFKCVEVMFDGNESRKHQMIAVQRIGKFPTPHFAKLSIKNREESVRNAGSNDKLIINTDEACKTRDENNLSIIPPTKKIIKSYYSFGFPLGTNLTRSTLRSTDNSPTDQKFN